MPKQLTTAKVVELLRFRQGERSQKELADELGISQQFLSDIYAGYREPGEKVLEQMGLTKRTVYEEA